MHGDKPQGLSTRLRPGLIAITEPCVQRICKSAREVLQLMMSRRHILEVVRDLASLRHRRKHPSLDEVPSLVLSSSPVPVKGINCRVNRTYTRVVG